MAYTIPNAMTLESKKFKQIRLGLQAAPNVGKTTAALTFPNPVIADFDNKLSATNAECAGKKLSEITIIPFYNAEFVDKIVPRAHPLYAPNKKMAFSKWLMTEGVKLEEDQTLIVDSWTMLQAAFDQQQSYETSINKAGKEDKFVFWQAKIEYSKDIMERLKTLRCNVVVTFHEIQERDDEGRPTGKLKPLMQGQFTDQLAGHFTDWFRAHVIQKHKDPANPKSEIIGAEYIWQTTSDNTCNCGCHLSGIKPRVPATYDVFANPSKYKL